MRALIQVRGAAGLRLGAAVDHRVEIAIDGHREAVGAHGTGEPSRHMKAIERDDAALSGSIQ